MITLLLTALAFVILGGAICGFELLLDEPTRRGVEEREAIAQAYIDSLEAICAFDEREDEEAAR